MEGSWIINEQSQYRVGESCRMIQEGDNRHAVLSTHWPSQTDHESPKWKWEVEDMKNSQMYRIRNVGSDRYLGVVELFDGEATVATLDDGDAEACKWKIESKGDGTMCYIQAVQSELYLQEIYGSTWANDVWDAKVGLAREKNLALWSFMSAWTPPQ